VLSRWAQNPNRSEESIFNEFCLNVLKLSASDTSAFRKLCLLSADAVYRGIRGIHNEITPWWTRDQYMGRPPLPEQAAMLPEFLQQKDEAVKMWTEVLSYANAIHFPDPAVQEYVEVSCRYGLNVYEIYRCGFQLAALGPNGDKAQIAALIKQYDQTWAEYHRLKEEHPSCATLYEDKAFRDKPGMGAMVDEFRRAVQQS
jgi:hypothetical protein